MSFTITPRPSKEEVFQKSDEECADLATTLRSLKCVFLDPDFLPNAQSLGKIVDEDGNMDFENINDPWHTPEQLVRKNGYDSWQVWEDPWPFHIAQGNLGNCWLLAAIKTIARRRSLLEEILPKRDYTVDCGIVQVRLCVDHEWQVIKTDYYIPQDDGVERCAAIAGNQLWVAFVEKAFAKLKGTYGSLLGGCPQYAFRCLTGFNCKTVWLKEDMDLEQLWEDLIIYQEEIPEKFTEDGLSPE